MSELQILVNHYNEDRDTVRRFLSSLAMQTDVDFEVILHSDGGSVRLTREDVEGYPFGIEYEYANHAGVCQTRNAMLDYATAEWVMFCDVDDYFHADGLHTLMDMTEGMDVVGSTYLSEGPQGQTVPMRRDTIRIHAKVFRRQYLVDNQIRFPDLETSGDMSFTWLAYSLTDRVMWLDEPTYTWAWNPTSVTRSHPWHHVRSYDRTIECYITLAHDLERRERPDLLDNLLSTLIAMTYVDTTGKRWRGAPMEYRVTADRAIRAMLAEYWERYTAIPKQRRRNAYETMAKYLRESADEFDGIEKWACERMADGGVLIVGYGVVGHNLADEIKALRPAVYDKYKGVDGRIGGRHYAVAFVCVDTPKTEDSPCDTSEVVNAINENDAEVYVIKSTVPVGTTDAIARETGKSVIFSPEYYGGTQHCNNYDFDFTILGGEKAYCVRVQQLLQCVYDGRHVFRITDARTAELAKYMENCWLAYKVSFCCQFFDVAEQMGVRYEELRELFVLDPRVNPSHTFVYRDHPYWHSHCLDKDVPALVAMADAPLIDAVIDYNERRRDG